MIVIPTEIRMENQNDNEILETLQTMLALQEQQLEIVKHHYERAERLQDRAEEMQEKASTMVTYGRRAFLVVIPILIILIIYVSGLLFSIS